ncbi:hypothetical protein C2R22_05960 [Salinigranum rubrum]|uniref:Uncharacterized protein n=1 Tax=Salinigranum rubrum TaxID=755307 RepID=A0A2I8VH52_9EURY|nr:hypothetical protein [Salinigranum rubrum]AUV81263.1 hypothetical protein C2R22_05960 [Salinigranum rubrum]
MSDGDLTLFEPGQDVTVELVADSSGNVAGLGTLVEISGETSEHTQVQQVETAGAGVATVARLPRNYDDTKSYSNGEVVGEAAVLLRHAVDWVEETTPGSLSAGDKAISDAGGTVAAYDPGGGDTGDMVLGPVWTTLARGQYVADKVAVVRQR